MNESQTRYFHALNSNQRVAGVAFEPVDIFAGTLFGVFSTSDQELAAAIVKVPHATEITQTQYEDYLKKKIPSLSEYRHSNTKSSPGIPLKGDGAVVVESPSNPVSSAPAVENLLQPKPIEQSAGIGRRKK